MNLAPLNPSMALDKLEHQQQKAKRKLKSLWKQQAKLTRKVQPGALSKQQICWGVTGFVGIFALGLGLAYLIKSKSHQKESDAEPEQKSHIIQQG